MNQTEKLELLANALISEVVPLASQFESTEAFNAVFRAKVKDCMALFMISAKERHSTAIAGKNIIQVFVITFKHMLFFNKMKKWLPDLIEDASTIALDLSNKKSILELQKMGLSGTTLDGAMTTILDETMLESGL